MRRKNSTGLRYSSVPGYSAKTAREIGRQNLTKLDIAEAIEKARTKRAERTEVSADWVVDEAGLCGQHGLGMKCPSRVRVWQRR